MRVVILPSSSYITYNAPTTYTIKVMPDLVIPQGSVISLMFPPTIGLLQGLANIACQIQFGGYYVNSITPLNSTSPISFVITTAFNQGAFTNVGASGGSFYIVCNGLQNPLTLDPTTSFSISIYDSSGCGIQSVSSGVILYLYGLPSF